MGRGAARHTFGGARRPVARCPAERGLTGQWRYGGGGRRWRATCAHHTHSHCDPRWLDTSSVTTRRTSPILSGVLSQLWADRSRRFVWAEISFFTMVDHPELREPERQTLVDRDSWSSSVGWVQNDEANPTLESVINQVSEGHAFAGDFESAPR